MIALDAAEIILHADVRLGELARELPKVPAEESGRMKSGGPRNGLPSEQAKPAEQTLLDDMRATAMLIARIPRSTRGSTL